MSYRFGDVELYPKAKQPRLPLFVAGNTERAIRRTARWGDGWLPASLPLPQLAAGNARLRAYAEQAGRDPTHLSVATQLVVCLGRTQAEAEERFKASPIDEEWTTVGLSGVPLEGFLGANLIGTPEEVCRRLAAIERTGVDHLAGLVFPGHTVADRRGPPSRLGAHVEPGLGGSLGRVSGRSRRRRGPGWCRS